MPLTRPPFPALPIAVAALLAAAPAASADVAFDRPNEDQVLLARDGAAAKVIARDGAFPSLSANGATLAYVHSEEGTVRLVRGSRKTTVRARDRGRRRTLKHMETVELSGDARRLLARDRYRWRLVDLATGSSHTVTQDESVRPRFSPDGTLVAWSGLSGGAYVRRADGQGGTVRLAGAEAVAVSWFGGELAVLQGDEGARRVTLVDPTTRATRDLPVDAAGASGLGPSFGTTRLTISSGGTGRDVERIAVVEAGGPVVRTLTAGRAILGDSAGFSIDGGTLYVLRGPDLYAVDLASGAERRLARKVGLELSTTRAERRRPGS